MMSVSFENFLKWTFRVVFPTRTVQSAHIIGKLFAASKIAGILSRGVRRGRLKRLTRALSNRIMLFTLSLSLSLSLSSPPYRVLNVFCTRLSMVSKHLRHTYRRGASPSIASENNFLIHSPILGKRSSPQAQGSHELLLYLLFTACVSEYPNCRAVPSAPCAAAAAPMIICRTELARTAGLAEYVLLTEVLPLIPSERGFLPPARVGRSPL